MTWIEIVQKVVECGVQPEDRILLIDIIGPHPDDGPEDEFDLTITRSEDGIEIIGG